MRSDLKYRASILSARALLLPLVIQRARGFHNREELLLRIHKHPHPSAAWRAGGAKDRTRREKAHGVDCAVLVAIELVDHGLELVVGEVLTEVARDPPHVLQRDHPRPIIVEQPERLCDLLVRIPGRNLLRHCVADERQISAVCSSEGGERRRGADALIDRNSGNSMVPVPSLSPSAIIRRTSCAAPNTRQR